MNRRYPVVAALLSATLLAACGTGDSAQQIEGRWEGPGRTAITLNADGTAEGNDGCNNLGAEWMPEDDTSGTFVVREASDMACEGIAGWEEATAYVFSGDRLTITTEDGSKLTELTRGS